MTIYRRTFLKTTSAAALVLPAFDKLAPSHILLA
jgi:hypothetical protein